MPKASDSEKYPRKYVEKIKFYLYLSENLYRKQVAMRYAHKNTQQKLNFTGICPKIYTESK
jgi:hypothetical protein